ncbi:hypothetical protein AAMO2058_001670600 [Amorphochlora amoebiformis]
MSGFPNSEHDMGERIRASLGNQAKEKYHFKILRFPRKNIPGPAHRRAPGINRNSNGCNQSSKEFGIARATVDWRNNPWDSRGVSRTPSGQIFSENSKISFKSAPQEEKLNEKVLALQRQLDLLRMSAKEGENAVYPLSQEIKQSPTGRFCTPSPQSIRSLSALVTPDCKRGGKTKYKTEICDQWMCFGVCKFGQRCDFAHGSDQLCSRILGKNFKSMMCPELFARNSFRKRNCRYGDRCTFAHPSDMVRVSSARDYQEKVIPHKLRLQYVKSGKHLPEDDYQNGFVSIAV